MSKFEIDFESQVGRHELEPASDSYIKQWRARHPGDLGGMSDSVAALHLANLVPKGRFKTVRLTSEMLEKSVRALVECKKTPFHKVALTVANTVGGWSGDKHPIGMWRSVAATLRLMFEGKAYTYAPSGMMKTTETQDGEIHTHEDFDWVHDEKTDDWYPRQVEVRWPHPAAQNVGELGICLIPGQDGGPVLALRPYDIQGALVLYGARMLATGTNFQTCQHCHTPFLSGAGGKRRGDARFCSDECRYGFHNATRRKSARKAKL